LVQAIVAGFVAQLACDSRGDIGPFQYAIALTVLALVLIAFFWSENFGDKPTNTTERKSELHALAHTMRASFQVIRDDPRVLLLGLSQAAFEGAVYSFGE
jgi:hypothetical protein